MPTLKYFDVTFTKVTISSKVPACGVDVCVPPPGAIKNAPSSDFQNSMQMNLCNAALTHPSPSNHPDGPEHLALFKANFWEAGKVLNVAFQGGTEWQHSQVKKYAPEWAEYGNFTFSFQKTDILDILISFDPSNGSWSYIGTECKEYASKEEPSMNLGRILDSITAKEIQRTILHEFGHALGCIHEHQGPRANIKWNKLVIYEELKAPPNEWNRDKVDQNIFTIHPEEQCNTSPFDLKSVMLYYYPPHWTLDGKGTPQNNYLSERDKKNIAFCYAKDLVLGLFNTEELRSWDRPVQENSKVKKFQEIYDYCPRFAIGINMIDMFGGANLRLECKIDNITNKNFIAHINTWGDSTLYTGGMTWLEAGSKFESVETGTFCTSENRSWDRPQLENSRRIYFNSSYTAPPKVVVWLSGFDLDKSPGFRIMAYASDVTKDGFTINIDSWADTIMYTGIATWLAYPADSKQFGSGTFSTEDIRPWDKPRAENSGVTEFTTRYSKTPKVFMAINKLDYEAGKNLRVRLSSSFVTRSKIEWRLQSWGDSIMYTAAASYFTFP